MSVTATTSSDIAARPDPRGWPLRGACALGALAMGAPLLAKVWGIAPLRPAFMATAFPGAVFVLAAAWWSRRARPDLAATIAVGAVGGLIGTLGYDLLRVPFAMMGHRVFTPVSAFGLWALDASASSRWTETAGWAFHDANGVCFGIAYALIARPGTPWIGGLVWAFALETLAVLSPFGRIFALRGHLGALAIAYWGHVGYGVPLGWMVGHFDATRRSLAELDPTTGAVMTGLVLALLAWPLLRAEPSGPRGEPPAFAIRGDRIVPEWLRVSSPGIVRVVDASGVPRSVVLRGPDGASTLTVRDSVRVDLPPAIYQLFVATPHRSHSSFLMVEPVESIRSR